MPHATLESTSVLALGFMLVLKTVPLWPDSGTHTWGPATRWPGHGPSSWGPASLQPCPGLHSRAASPLQLGPGLHSRVPSPPRLGAGLHPRTLSLSRVQSHLPERHLLHVQNQSHLTEPRLLRSWFQSRTRGLHLLCSQVPFWAPENLLCHSWGLSRLPEYLPHRGHSHFRLLENFPRGGWVCRRSSEPLCCCGFNSGRSPKPPLF